MPFTLENAIVAGLVASAAVYVAWRVGRTCFAKDKAAGSGCGSCSACPENSPAAGAAQKPIVTTEELIDFGRKKPSP